MFDKRWLYTPGGDISTQISFIEELLIKRGINEAEEIRLFMSPEIEKSADPFLLEDMDKAVETILEAVENEAKIAVFGDYDADGITSSAMLCHFLEHYLQADVFCYIPDRVNEGYGMSLPAVEAIAQKGTGLIITVDNGIKCHAEIELAYELGMQVVVTDHHKCAQTLPKCEAVVDPAREDCRYPCKYLAGAGVTYKLIEALSITAGIFEDRLIYLPLAAMGTIGDSVPLRGDNRIIASAGIKTFGSSPWAALNVLIDKLEVKCSPGRGVSSTAISYAIVPKINAAGRMGDAMRAFNLLTAKTPEEAEKLAQELISENARRQMIETEIFKESIMPEHIQTCDSDSIVVTLGNDWNHGIIGIVASRLCEKYSKPAIVFAVQPNVQPTAEHNVQPTAEHLGRGSARSIDGFNIHEALVSCQDCLIRFGGHEKAAGMEIEVSKIPELIKGLNKYAEDNGCALGAPPAIEIDIILTPADLTIKTAKLLEAFEPFGEGNPPPVIAITGLYLEQAVLVGASKKHVRLVFSAQVDGSKQTFEGIAFNSAKYMNMFSRTKECSVLANISINTYNGSETISLKVTDLYDGEYNKLVKKGESVYNTTNGGFSLNRQILAAMYRELKAKGEHFTFDDLYAARDKLRREGLNLTWYVLKMGIAVFTELGLVERKSPTMFRLPPVSQKHDLRASELYRYLESE